ncbi:hypothetical protein EI546_00185 [Aequorivita sp. H23M31]|uniref:Uncharacterized protein n=1 Tax=Aequorivita ciconiae TaxID=2494375 RepID=A0A451FS87_9FLAO|nr:hypothetical protein [Aequorivita sp. H23M31]QAA80244.1 hypothetical protein EI546_00185 [Aequorivita sp. H23M31]
MYIQDIKISTPNYDALLNGWSTLTLQPDVQFYGGLSTYCAGETPRLKMMRTFDYYRWRKNCGDPMKLDLLNVGENGTYANIILFPDPMKK